MRKLMLITTREEISQMEDLKKEEMCSGVLAELFKALSKAQGMISGAIKDKTNPHFKSSYADLSSCWEAAREPLSSNGLSVIQTIEQIESGESVLITILAHSSGQWIKSKTPLINQKKDMQGLGSAITYARRFALCSIVGISPEDDDGNESVKPEKREPVFIDVIQQKTLMDKISELESPEVILNDILRRTSCKSLSVMPLTYFKSCLDHLTKLKEKTL